MDIKIGKASVRWPYAIGNYTIQTLQAIPLNSLEKVILGLLSNMQGTVTETRLGNIMGFNIADDPTNHRYRDSAECEILHQGLQELKDDGLISTDSESYITLTEAGAKAFDEGKKHKGRLEERTLYFDMLGGDDSNAKALFENIEGSIIKQDATVSIDEERGKSAIKFQFPDLVDESRGKSIGNITCNSLVMREKELSLDIIYHLQEKTYTVQCSGEDAEKFRKTVDSNSIMRNEALDSFFSQAKESIVYKPAWQTTLEDKTNADNDTVGKNIFCTQTDLIHELLCQEKTNLPLVSFFLKELSREDTLLLSKLASKNNFTMICVEFCEGDESFNNYRLKNLSYRKVENMPVAVPCILSSGQYYGEELFVLEYKGMEYQIPLVIKHEECRFKAYSLTKAFANDGIEEMTKVFISRLQTARTNAYPIDKYTLWYERILFLRSKYSTLIPNVTTDCISKLKEEWMGYLKYKKNQLVRDVRLLVLTKSGANKKLPDMMEKLGEFRSVYQKYLGDTPDIDKIIGRGKLLGPVVSKQHAYIVDASSFIHNPKCLEAYKWETDVVFIPQIIWDELNHLKDGKNEDKAAKARQSLRNIDIMSSEHPQIRIEPVTESEVAERLPGFDTKTHDYYMLALALRLVEDKKKYNAVTIICYDNPFSSTSLRKGIDVRQER